MDSQTAIEEIALIKRVIDDSRRFAVDNGKYALLWGVLVTAAVFAEYWLILVGRTQAIGWIWMGVGGIGWIISMIWVFRSSSKRSGWPIGAKLVGMVWLSCGVAITILVFVATGSGALPGWAVCPSVAVIMGVGYVITGIIYRLMWVSFVGVAWWLGSLLMYMVKGLDNLLIFGVMMILFQIIPGIVFYIKSKRNRPAAEAN